MTSQTYNNAISNASDFSWGTSDYILSKVFETCTTYEGLKSYLAKDVKKLTPLGKKALAEFIESNDYYGLTPLEQAVQSQDHSFLKDLYELGVDFNTLNSNGESILKYVQYFDTLEVILDLGYVLDPKCGFETEEALGRVFGRYSSYPRENPQENMLKFLEKHILVFLSYIDKANIQLNDSICLKLLEQGVFNSTETSDRIIREFSKYIKSNYNQCKHLLNNEKINQVVLLKIAGELLQLKSIDPFQKISSLWKKDPITQALSQYETDVSRILGWRILYEKLNNGDINTYNKIRESLSLLNTDCSSPDIPSQCFSKFIDVPNFNRNIRAPLHTYNDLNLFSTCIKDYIRSKHPNHSTHDLFCLNLVDSCDFEKPLDVIKDLVSVIDSKELDRNQDNLVEAHCRDLIKNGRFFAFDYANKLHNKFNLDWFRAYSSHELKLSNKFIAEQNIQLPDDLFLQPLLLTLLKVHYKFDDYHPILRITESEFESLLQFLQTHEDYFLKLLPSLIWYQLKKPEYQLIRICDLKSNMEFDNAEIQSLFSKISQGEAWVIYCLNHLYEESRPVYNALVKLLSSDYKKDLYATGEIKIANFYIPETELIGSELLPVSELQSEKTLEPKVIETIETLRKPTIGIRHLVGLFANLDDHQIRELLYFYFTHPKEMNFISQKYFFEGALYIEKGKHFKHSYARFVHALLGHLTTHHRKSDIELKKSYKICKIPHAYLNLHISGEIEKLGRTLLVKQEDKITAYKFKHTFSFDHKMESLKNFAGEFAVTKAYKERSFLFNSQIAQPERVLLVGEVTVDHPTFGKEFSGNNRFIYQYEATSKKFIYLNDKNLTQKEFVEARECCLNDSILQILHGIYPDSVALFHNDSTNRKYLPFIDIFRMMIAIPDTQGAGRIDAYRSKIQFPNMRQNGALVDLNDAVLFEDAIRHKELISTDFNYGYEREIVSTLLQMNAIGRLLLVDMLLLCDRYDKQNKLKWNDNGVCAELGNLLKDGFVCMLKKYTGEKKEACRLFADNSGVNWIRMAKQCCFWIDQGSEGYRPWMMKDTVPDGLYAPEMALNVNVGHQDNFTPQFGLSENKIDPDIGVFNGALPLTEFQKALHIFVPWALALAERNHLAPQAPIQPQAIPPEKDPSIKTPEETTLLEDSEESFSIKSPEESTKGFYCSIS